ncbi:NADH-quinone oxidoreductase subunit 5 family protein [Herbidospora yilanensis]|uniref:NADH-quinone oxidoreductase subunit 5 family protein n=1 Tax=Herbidospora yilanensis TaxID=354426 RepID=UPI0007C64ECD|nr:NADH-quinone oxidoreductase subunit L [Herbidospora yilanensis]
MIVSLVVVLPLAGAVLGLLLSRRPHGRGPAENLAANKRAAWFGVLPTALSTALIGWLAWENTPSTSVLTVIDTGGIAITAGLEVAELSVLTAMLVGVVALAVQVYSVGYMRGESRYPSFSAFISLFTSAMLLVVFAADLLVLYVGWEIMGLCSYLLVGHWWEERANSRAAIKAFLVTRLGDVGFLFGIFVLGFAAGSFRVADILVADIPESTLVLATLLLLAGVAGKSAQVPLHTWLPDAMAGPTPISALIHAATMVAAGIFVVARLYVLFPQPTLDVLGVAAAIGMLGAALAAFAQTDLKRVLAYSTISQLAYMAAALAGGARDAAVFHLVTHGAFKALLFLCAGAVIHHVGSNLLGHMGGLRRPMPMTFWAMTVGYAALIGLPPASGFFSKDAILYGLERSSSPIQLLLYGSALLTVGVTGAYATRAWLMTFFGTGKIQALPEPAPGTAHVFDGREAPLSMLWPMGVLAIPALLLGFTDAGEFHLAPALTALVVALLGAAFVYVVWRGAPERDPARLLGAFRDPCEQAFYVDRLYAVVFVRPVLALARGVVRTDDHVVDGAVRGTGRAAVGLSGLTRHLQNGNAQLYVTGLLAGVLLIAVGAVVLG